jgi:hypothetical protein
VSARSRKRGRRTRGGGQPAGTTRRQPVGTPRPQPTDAAPAETPSIQAAYRRGEARNEAIRATLTPLAPGERPWPLLVAIVLAVLVAVGDIVQLAIGGSLKFGSSHTSIPGTVLFSVLMLVCAAGMWRQRYWAVLGFQALLALVVIAFALVLVDANDILRGVIAVAVIAAGGYLFFKLVRVLSRLQMPSRSGQP